MCTGQNRVDYPNFSNMFKNDREVLCNLLDLAHNFSHTMQAATIRASTISPERKKRKRFYDIKNRSVYARL